MVEIHPCPQTIKSYFMPTCFGCGNSEFPVKWSRLIKAYMCIECDNALFFKRKMIAYCTKCNKEHYTDVQEAPFICDKCKKAQDANMAVDHMIAVWKDGYKNLIFKERFNLACAYIRRSLGLSPTTPVIGKIRDIGVVSGKTLPEMVNFYYRLELTEQAIREIIEISREHGMGAYAARKRDSVNLEFYNMETNYVGYYKSELGGTICLGEEDNACNLPF